MKRLLFFFIVVLSLSPISSISDDLGISAKVSGDVISVTEWNSIVAGLVSSASVIHTAGITAASETVTTVSATTVTVSGELIENIQTWQTSTGHIKNASMNAANVVGNATISGTLTSAVSQIASASMASANFVTAATMPNGAAPAPAVTGGFGFDTTDKVFTIHDGTAARVYADGIYQQSFVCSATAATGIFAGQYFPLMFTPKDMAITLVEVDIQVTNASVGVYTGLEVAVGIEARGNAALTTAGTDIVSGSYAQVTQAIPKMMDTFAASVIPASSWLVAKVPANGVTGNPQNIIGTVFYRKNLE